NILVDTSVQNGSGLTVALRRTAATLANYATTSNHNDLYAGSPSASHLLYYDGTTSVQTITAFKTAVTPSDSASFTENPSFLSTTGSSANFLHINTAIDTLLESGGAAIAGLADDFDND